MLARDLQPTPGPREYLARVQARDLQLTPGPRVRIVDYDKPFHVPRGSAIGAHRRPDGRRTDFRQSDIIDRKSTNQLGRYRQSAALTMAANHSDLVSAISGKLVD